ncbi:hypothetical protein J2T17_005429 [Paenibacillus mucilaginosus]|uniref:hypothetical protein n=1 Tax=Paenibacillus mucilaginosus TaxID=61624 RepID=UPI003D252E47
MKKTIFSLLWAAFLLIGSIVYYFEAYRPAIGPVGRGVNDSEVFGQFLYGMLQGGAVLTAALIGAAAFLRRRRSHPHSKEDGLMPHEPDDPGLAKLPPQQLEALRAAARVLDPAGIPWGLGGSALLYVRGLTGRFPNDLDLLIAEDQAPRAFELLSALGPSELRAPEEPYCTLHFRRFTLGRSSADLIAGFGIRHSAGVYRLLWRHGEALPRLPLYGTPAGIPLTSLEDWYVLYLLLPGRADKAALIEAHWRDGGPLLKDRLSETLGGPLPPAVRERVLAVCRTAGVEESGLP